MIDLREYEVPSPQPPAPDRVHRDGSVEPDADRLVSLLAGVAAVRPIDDVVCLHLARRNLLVTAWPRAA